MTKLTWNDLTPEQRKQAELSLALVEARVRAARPHGVALELHAVQAQIKREAKRFNVPCLGRRAGKTLFCIDLARETMQAGQPVGWFAPTYKLLDEAWREIKERLKPITKAKGGVSEQQKRIETTNGGVLECWSLEPPGGEEAGRGRKYKRAIIDEAARVANLEAIWNRAVQPTLADLQGDAWFPSTPKGFNYFHTLYQRGQDPSYPEWMSWQMPSTANTMLPGLIEEIARAQRDTPELDFAQEWLAQFIADGGLVFRRLDRAQRARVQERGDRQHLYVVACDWAKYNDFSVFGVIDTFTKELVAIERHTQIEYTYQIDRLVALCERFGPVAVVSEETGNLALTEMLERTMYRHPWTERIENLPIRVFKTTAASKLEIVQGLALGFERGELAIPKREESVEAGVLLGELQAFTTTRTPSGNLVYGAPDGMHDDTVMMLGMGWHEAKRFMPELQTTEADRVNANMRQFGWTDEWKNTLDPASLQVAGVVEQMRYQKLIREDREANCPVYGIGKKPDYQHDPFALIREKFESETGLTLEDTDFFGEI